MGNDINGFEVQEWNIHGFDLKGKTTGKVDSTCPFCSHTRTKKKDKCARVFLDTGWFECYHCGENGQVHSYKRQNQTKEYVKPPQQDFVYEYSEALLKWFQEERHISESTLKRLKITEGPEWMPQPKAVRRSIKFNYFIGKDLINIKFRDREKNFKLVSGAEKIMYNLNAIFNEKEAIIVEGECFPPETEILTENGWVSFADYEGQKVLQVNDDDTSEFVEPKAVIKKKYEDDLIELRNTKGYSSISTKGHNYIVEKKNSKGKYVRRKITAEKIYNTKLASRIPRVLNGINNKGVDISDDMLRLHVMISADFSIRKNDDIYGCFKKDRKAKRAIKLLGQTNTRYSVNIDARDYYSFFIHRDHKLNAFKLFPHEWLGQLSLRQMNIILDEILFWDGNSVPNREQIEYSSKEIQNCTFIQTLAHICGYCSTIIPRKNQFGEWFKVSILFNKTATSAQNSLERKKVPYKGNVYCVNVPSGKILTRYQNCITIIGNCDVAAYAEAGVYNVTSVPNGFNLKGELNLDYLTNCYEYFENKEKIYLAVDNDEAGQKGQRELVRRFGAEKIWLIDFKDCKDANDYLVKYGKLKLQETVANAKQFPLENILTIEDEWESLESFWEHGAPRGMTMGLKHQDEAISFDWKQYTLLLSAPGAGKSEKIDDVLARLIFKYNIKAAYCSVENQPYWIHYNKIFKKVYGTTPKKEDIKSEEVLNIKHFINDNFFHVNFEKRYYLQDVLAKFEELVKRKGVRFFVLDPFNKITLKGVSKADINNYTAEYHMLIDEFVKKNDCHLLLVLHPTKLTTKEGSDKTYIMPTAYHAKGGGEHFDMSYNIIGMVRDYERNLIHFRTLKVKFQHLGTSGIDWFEAWNINNGRFTQIEDGYDIRCTHSPEIFWHNGNWMHSKPWEKFEKEKINEEDLPDKEELPAMNPNVAFDAPVISDKEFEEDDEIPF